MALTQVVVKLNRTCNLRCTYCYYINDQTPDPGKRMPAHLLLQFLDKYSAYCEHQGIRGRVVFHGGEPLLMGKRYFTTILAHPAFHSKRIKASVQTNGLLIDPEWAELFSTARVACGVSLDGPPEVHDHDRITASGRGSYQLVVRGIRYLQDAGIPVTVLCVVRPGVDGAEVFHHLISLGITELDFLPPISSHAQQTIAPIDLEGIRVYLVRAFTAWVAHGDPSISVRLFNEMFWRWSLGRPGYSPIGIDDWSSFAVLECDGTFARFEELADTEAFDSRPRYLTAANIVTHGIEEAVSELSLANANIDYSSLPHQCATCEMNDVCNGGNLASRFDVAGSFDNPGVHCTTFFALARIIKQLAPGLRPESPPSSLSTYLSETARC